MRVFVQPLYVQLNTGVGDCPLGCAHGCQVVAQAPKLASLAGGSCPLLRHQADTWAALRDGNADVLFNTAPTGAGKTLAGCGLSLVQPGWRLVSCYPTNELIEDQARSLRHWHEWFELDYDRRVLPLYGERLSQQVEQQDSSRFLVLTGAIQNYPLLLTNPDLLHYMVHFRYRDPAYGADLLPVALADFPDLWVFDEFHLFGPHQEAAVLNGMALIRRLRGEQRPRRFLFTSATPKPAFQVSLQQTGWTIQTIPCSCVSVPTDGYRPIAQGLELAFVQLERGQEALDWLLANAGLLRAHLQAEGAGRGLVLLNSVAQAAQAVSRLQAVLPGVLVREISGRMDRQQRAETQALLRDAPQPVLVIGTSAVDVGVDFRIHLLITESSDAATVIQRLGRLGRHPGFSAYHAYVLISGSTPWVMARLQQQLQAEQVIERSEFVAAIQEAFDPPPAFPEYQQRWGVLQAQGLLWQMGGENQAVMQPIRQRLVEDFQKLYGLRVQPWLGAWRDLEKTDVGRAVQQELLRFRGGTTLQAAVWDGESFYTYDLLRLLPYVQVDVLSREDFLQAAAQAGWSELAFPEPWIHLYVRVQRWEIERLPWTLRCNHHTDDLAVGELTLLSRVSVQGHPQDRAINRVLARQKLLGFLVPLTAQQSPFDVRRHLRLSPLFGLYPLHDGDNQPFACAFNQDALLLEALKGRLAPFLRTHRPSLIF